MNVLHSNISHAIGKLTSQEYHDAGIRQIIRHALGLALFYFEPNTTLSPYSVDNHPVISGMIQGVYDQHHNYNLATIGYLEAKLTKHEFLFGEELGGTAALEKRTILNNDIRNDGSLVKKMQDIGDDKSQSAIVVPLRIGEQVEGILGVFANQSGYFREGDVHYLEFIAGSIIVIWQYAKSVERAQLATRISLINNRMLNENITRFDEINDFLIKQIESVLLRDQEHIHISVFWRNQEAFEVIATNSINHTFGSFRSTDDVIIKTVVENGIPLRINRINNSDVVDCINQVPPGVQSIIATPIWDKGRNLSGVLRIESRQENRFIPDEILFMTNIAAQIAIVKEFLDMKEKEIAIGTLGYMEMMALSVNHQTEQPLCMIIGYADDTVERVEQLKGTVSANNQDQIDTILRNLGKICDAQQFLVEEFEHYREIFGKQGESYNYPVSKGLDEAIKRAQTRLEGYGVKLDISVDCPEHLLVRGNNKVTSYFRELIINAGKYAIDKKGRLVIQAIPKYEENKVEITFSDNGPGIPENQLEKIFQAGFQVKKTAHVSGSGWGLPAARLSFRALRGDLKAENSGLGNGHGATFRVQLRLAGGTTQPLG